jgi:hypothetical protein
LVAFGAYKFSQRDADRIEEHTGIPPEEMTDEELEQAADELGIEVQKRTTRNKAPVRAAFPKRSRNSRSLPSFTTPGYSPTTNSRRRNARSSISTEHEPREARPWRPRVEVVGPGTPAAPGNAVVSSAYE